MNFIQFYHVYRMFMKHVPAVSVGLYLREPEVLDPRLQHVFESAVHLLGVLHLNHETQQVRSERCLRLTAALTDCLFIGCCNPLRCL